MLSIRNDKPDAVLDTGERILAAAASCVVDFGVDRVTLAEIARRAGVSRPTVYRRWPDTRSIVAALLTRHVTDVMRPRRCSATTGNRWCDRSLRWPTCCARTDW